MIIPIWTDVDGKDWEECLSDLNLEIYAKQLKDDVFQYLQDQGHHPVPVMPGRRSADITQFVGTNAILAEAINACKEKIKQEHAKRLQKGCADFEAFLDGPYKENWHKAYDLGVQARKDGLPKVCNITDPKLCHNGNAFKPYESAWNQGWDGYTIPEIFSRIEQNLAKLPTRPMTLEDF
jgi:hypothetical protein